MLRLLTGAVEGEMGGGRRQCCAETINWSCGGRNGRREEAVLR